MKVSDFVLCVPATSAPAKCVFSAMINVHSLTENEWIESKLEPRFTAHLNSARKSRSFMTKYMVQNFVEMCIIEKYASNV